VGANTLVLSLPIVAFFGLRIYDTYLLRQTERQLIAQAVFVAEAWREALAQWHGPDALTEFRPPGRAGSSFVPVQPIIDLGTRILPPQPKALPCAEEVQNDTVEAARVIEPLLKRAQVFTLSAIRILDTRGCVIATTRAEKGKSLKHLPEVGRALGGHYSAVMRRRISDEPTPPLIDVRRRGKVRVFAALPVFCQGEVIGVVRLSRTSLSALRSLWLNRRGLLMGAVICGVVVILASLLFASAITRPLHRLQADARAIVEGRRSRSFAQRAWTPLEFKALAESLTTMTEKLRERAEYTSAYAANVTHELKTPITSIRGAAELLRDGMSTMSVEQSQRFLSNIEADAVRMERLVTQLLQLARIENATEAESGEIEVESFFEGLIARYPSRVSLSSVNPPRTISMNADHLISAVTNLIDNALEQDPDSKVEIGISAKAQHLVVSVTDNGPGIPKAHLQRVFERFFTTKGDQGGTGLGLSMVKAIVEARGGSITVKSQSGDTAFTLVL
jgi:signal transduction histidine kinase